MNTKQGGRCWRALGGREDGLSVRLESIPLLRFNGPLTIYRGLCTSVPPIGIAFSEVRFELEDGLSLLFDHWHPLLLHGPWSLGGRREGEAHRIGWK